MQFYLPNFEDLVDPGYDFIHDRPSPERDNRFLHDWYAHQFFEEPIFDGVLMSKTVVSQRIEKLILEVGGVHAFMNLDPGVPVLGDCGAFSYSKEDEPPYTTEEILGYYEALGFTYGVSIDHVIFGSFDRDEQKRRWELTLRNAKDFLRQHEEGGYTFTPVGIAQGQTPEMYGEAIHRLVQMGYDHLALGGLARSGDETVREVLQAVSPELPEGVDLHLFGVARLSLIPDLLRYGVTMVDSSSPLRRAFLGSNSDNYWMPNGTQYAAVRVPYAKRGAAKKRGVDSTDEILERREFTLQEFKEMEQESLRLLRAFDRGEGDLEETLETVLAYDHLHGKTRNQAEAYHRTLEDRPWQECHCPICQEVGIEVIIFRGNNRNRRRGFHNVKVFYDRFSQRVAACLRSLNEDGSDDPVQLNLCLPQRNR